MNGAVRDRHVLFVENCGPTKISVALCDMARGDRTASLRVASEDGRHVATVRMPASVVRKLVAALEHASKLIDEADVASGKVFRGRAPRGRVSP